MANKKITDLIEITSAANVDVLPIVDVSADVTNKIKVENLPISTATQTALDAKQATLVSGTNIKTINSTSLLGSGDIAISANPAGTAGQIQFSDGSAFAADSNLYWDNTNKYLGVGETTPTARVQIKGVGNTSSTSALFITNSDSTTNLFIKDNGEFYFGANNNTISGSSNNLFITGNNIYFKAGGNYAHNMTSAGLQLGNGSASPTARLQVKGTGSTSATTSLLVQNSSGQTAIEVKDDKSIAIFENRIYDGFNQFKSFYISGNTTIVSNYQAISLRVFNGALYASGLEVVGDGAESRVGIGTTSPNASAKLQLDSTTKGFLPPRMTTTQKNAISTPAAGLMVYDTSLNQMSYYNGSAWINFG